MERLIEAFGRLAAGELDLHLLLVGDGPERRRLEDQVQERGLSRSVTFAGRVIEGVDEYFRAGDVFVLPGLGGLAISEALAHGLPVVCVQGDGCEVDLVRDGHTGYRVGGSTEDEIVDELTQSLRAVVGDHRRRAAMSAAALDMIRNEYNIGTFVSGVAAAIKEAHGGRGRGLIRRWMLDRRRRRGLGSA